MQPSRWHRRTLGILNTPLEKQLTSQELPKWAKEIDCTKQRSTKPHRMRGPICHVGPKLNAPEAGQEAARNRRRNFAHLEDPEFVGIDIFEGPNVDVLADICSDEFPRAHPELDGRFGLVLCRALLEHVQNPFAAAKNIGWLIKSGGHLCFVVPWVWGYHPCPSDYWRISFEALRVLFHWPSGSYDRSRDALPQHRRGRITAGLTLD